MAAPIAERGGDRSSRRVGAAARVCDPELALLLLGATAVELPPLLVLLGPGMVLVK